MLSSVEASHNADEILVVSSQNI